jgi:pimeloyl-ACP methyl ester carboxylesterase
VLLPGTASDHVFVADAFAGPLASHGIRLVAPPPVPGAGVVDGMLAALDAAARQPHGLLVGGVSLGGHVAASWAVRNRDRVAGLLVALPGWLGEPGPSAPGAVAARASAAAVRGSGLDATLDGVRAATPPWLAGELDRAWRAHGVDLADTMDTAAGTVAPTAEQLRTLTVPAGVVGATDDPVHPYPVARSWCAALPNAALVGTTLAAIGEDRTALGRAVLVAWLRAVPADPAVSR